MTHNFWEYGDYKSAHLSKLEYPENVMDIIFKWTQKPKNFLVFMGTPGTGKTYFIASMINNILEKGSPYQFRYFHERDFFGHMRETINKNWEPVTAIHRLCECEYLFLDDIGQGNLTDFQIECLQNVVDCRSITGYPTVITSNLFLNDMKEIFEPRFLSRINDKRNAIIELNWCDKRQNSYD